MSNTLIERLGWWWWCFSIIMPYLTDVPGWSLHWQMISMALSVWVATWCMEPMSIWTPRNTNQLTIVVSRIVHSPACYDLMFFADRPPSKALTQAGHGTQGELSEAEGEPENEESMSVKCKEQRQTRQRRTTNSMSQIFMLANSCVLIFSPFTQQVSVRRVIIQ